MSLDKSEIRIGVAHEIGCALDDALEAAKGETKFFEGGVSALVQTQKQVQALAKLVDDDLDGKGEGQVPDLATASLLKKYITRAVTIIESGAKSAENHRLMAEGKVRALDGAVTGVKKRVDNERLRLETLRLEAMKITAELQQQEQEERAAGEHPGRSIKDRRQAEELAGVGTKPKPSKKATGKKRGANS